MSIKDLAAILGKEAAYKVGGMEILVTVLDVRNAYGRIDYQIVPIKGCGTVWVSSDNVKIKGA